MAHSPDFLDLHTGTTVSEYRKNLRKEAENILSRRRAKWLFDNEGRLHSDLQLRWSNYTYKALSALAVLLEYTEKEDYNEHILRHGMFSWWELSGNTVAKAEEWFYSHDMDAWSTGFGTIGEDDIITAQFRWRTTQTYLPWFGRDFLGGFRYYNDPEVPVPADRKDIYTVQFPRGVSPETLYPELS